MVDDNILKPGGSSCHRHHDHYKELTHLYKENYLSEFQSEEEIQRVRRNLGLIADSELYERVKDIVILASDHGELDLLSKNVDIDNLKKQLEDKSKELISKHEEEQKEVFDKLKKELQEEIQNLSVTRIVKEEAIWKPTGPVQSMVGFVDDGDSFNKDGVTLQTLADAIFYGKLSEDPDIFVGVLTEAQKESWRNGGVDAEAIAELIEYDPVNNSNHYFNVSIDHAYDFGSPEPRYLAIAYPSKDKTEASYPNLRRIETGSQDFTPDAFWTPSVIGANNYKYYIYKQGIYELSTSILLRF